MFAQKTRNMNVSKRGGTVKLNEACRSDQSDSSGRGFSPSSQRVHSASPSALHRSSDAASACSAEALSDSSSIKRSAAATCGEETDSQKPYRQESKPKRPLTCYNMYFRCERKRILAKISEGLPPGTRPKIDFEELGRLISGRWKETPQEERKKYRAMAAVDRKRYERQMEEWRAYMGSVIDEMVGDEEGNKTEESEDNDRKPAAISQPMDQNATGLGGLMMMDPSFSFQTQGAQTNTATAIQVAMGMDNTFTGLNAGHETLNTDVAMHAVAAPAAHPSRSISLPVLPISPGGFARSGHAPLRRWMSQERHDPVSLATPFPLDWPAPSNHSTTAGQAIPSDFAFARPQRPTPTRRTSERFLGPPRVDRPDLIADLAGKLGDDGVDFVIRMCKSL